jgi:hypothetical protein
MTLDSISLSALLNGLVIVVGLILLAIGYSAWLSASRRIASARRGGISGDAAVDAMRSELYGAYQIQGLMLSSVAHLYALIFGVLSAVALAYAIFSVNLDRPFREQTAVILPLVSAAILAGMASLFLVSSNKARVLMSAVLEGLRDDRKLSEGLRLIDSVTDEKAKDRLRIALSLDLCRVKTSDATLARILLPPRTACRNISFPVRRFSDRRLKLVRRRW